MHAALHHHRAHVVRADHHVEQRVDAVGKERRGLKNADDGHRRAVQPQLLADDARVAAEALHPAFVREHHDGRNARPVVARPREPAEHRREPHDLEVVAGDEPRLDAHGAFVALERAASTANIRRCRRAIWRRRGSRALPGTEKAMLAPPRSVHRLSQVDQPVAVAVRQRLEQHAADDAEDRGVGADA